MTTENLELRVIRSRFYASIVLELCDVLAKRMGIVTLVQISRKHRQSLEELGGRYDFLYVRASQTNRCSVCATAVYTNAVNALLEMASAFSGRRGCDG